VNLRLAFLAAVLAAACAASTAAQTADLPDAPQPTVTLRSAPRNLLRDQAAIWTSPLHLRDSNAAGPVLLVLATTVAITADHQAMTDVVSHDKTLNNHADTASQGLVGGLVAIPAALYGLGRLRHDDHASETGLLGGEAILDSLAVNQVVKIVARRERPTVDNSRGRFFQSGVGFDSSFGSNHSAVAWSSAAVLADEYPGWLTRILVYGAAAGVSATRVAARQHFPGDVVASSGVGWMIGRYVVRRHRHHDID
jgi:hypothetical protein